MATVPMACLSLSGRAFAGAFVSRSLGNPFSYSVAHGTLASRYSLTKNFSQCVAVATIFRTRIRSEICAEHAFLRVQSIKLL